MVELKLAKKCDLKRGCLVGPIGEGQTPKEAAAYMLSLMKVEWVPAYYAVKMFTTPKRRRPGRSTYEVTVGTIWVFPA